MSVSYDHYIKNNLDVIGAITISNSIDMFSSSTLKLGQSTATKLELAKSSVTTEIKGPATALEGLKVTGASTITTTLAVGHAGVPAASAILELESTTKGLLFPRMTTVQRNTIVAPVAGLMVYDTNIGAIYYYNGTIWTVLTKNRVNETNLIIGEGSGEALTTGHLYNVLIGRNVGPVLTDMYNVFIGDLVATNALTSTGNISIGANSALGLTTGDFNTFIGQGCALDMTSGSYNTFIGDSAGSLIITGINNTMIGAATSGNSAFNNQIALGYQATAINANQVMVGNSAIVEMVPHSSATANLGTSTNAWNNVRLKGNASIGQAADPVASALVEMSSTTQGMLLPRMTTAQRTAISSPADGLLVYDTSRHSIFVYNSSTTSWFTEVIRRKFDGYNNDLSTCVNNAWRVLPINVERYKDVDSFTHAANSSEITILYSGVYNIAYKVVYTSSLTNRTYQSRLEEDVGAGFVAIVSSNIYGYSTSSASITVSGTLIRTFASGNKIRITSQSISNTTTFTALANAGALCITSM